MNHEKPRESFFIAAQVTLEHKHGQQQQTSCQHLWAHSEAEFHHQSDNHEQRERERNRCANTKQSHEKQS